MKVDLLCWNVWVDGDFDEIKLFLDDHPADIIALQEAREDDPTRNVVAYLAGKGYKFFFSPIVAQWGGVDHHFGVATFSRFPIIESEEILLVSDANPRKAQRIILDVHGERLTVFNTHLVHTHQKQSEVHQRQVDRLLESVPAERTVFMGDLNTTPDTLGVQRLRSILTDSDPTDTPTWSQYKAGCSVCQLDEIRYRLDYIFTTPDLKISNFRVEQSPASDHLPTTATIEF